MARSIDPTGARACFIAHDVTDEKQWTSVIQQTVERFGSLSILVNNAGSDLVVDGGYTAQ
jgi:NADP-dependent 3-hydroxy acid dehydrogenase YdfG